MQEMGVLNYWKTRKRGKSENSADDSSSRQVTKSQNSKVLTLSSCKSIFFILLYGFLFSKIIFVVELTKKRFLFLLVFLKVK